ncbi:thymidylate kinase [Streptomyces sp. S1A]|uniref:Thymidylate kinase n=1 Tax=Streptomyces chitinivorans TaxID=1257027 RepID=A0ABW7HQ24_9ACTN|nr:MULTISPECIES: thymidylate kinase [Streptomyces]MCG3038990.1 thymidylate kinase [Streptomyces sp. ICN903]MDH2411247.1 thymidylate kinase [Streptomyces chitinivorans]
MIVWVSLEGPNGVGKTRLAHRLAQRLGSGCVLLEEISDLRGDGLPPTLVGALAAGGDPFLRGASPLARTLVLLALKTRAFEQARCSGAAVVLEDRGVDTVAAYQAAVLAGTGAPPELLHREMERVYATVSAFRPLPDLTLLLLDDPAVCARRYALRTGRPMDAGERALSDCATALYRHRAEREPRRFRVVDRRGLDEDAVVDRLARAVVEATNEEEDLPCPTGT